MKNIFRTGIVALLVSWFLLTPVHAESSGVAVKVFDVLGQNNAPALADGQAPVCEMTLPSVVHNFDLDPLCNMYEDFIVQFTGYITVPVTGDISFYVPADDGARLILNGDQIINDWFDKGGGGSISAPVHMVAGQSVPFTLWYYENGGGTWVDMYLQYWDQDGHMAQAENSFFSQVEVTPIPSPTPSPTPTPEPTVEPTVDPTPSPTPTPTVEPTPSPKPSETPTPSPTPTPTPTEVVVPVETPTPTQTPDVVPSPIPTITPDPQPSEVPAPEASALAQAARVAAFKAQTHIELPKGLASVPGAVQLAHAAEAIMNIGSDMTPAQRKRAQGVVVSAIIVGQLAQIRGNK